MQLPESVRRVIETLSRLPSLGPRQATRLCFHLITRGQGNLKILAADMARLTDIKLCQRCFFIYEGQGGLCDICQNPNRHTGECLVIEKETDLLTIENSEAYGGVYHVLGALGRGGIITPDQKARLEVLRERVNNEKLKEIILALSHTTACDGLAQTIQKELQQMSLKITRLGRGLPMGAEIEFTDFQTIADSISSRK